MPVFLHLPRTAVSGSRVILLNLGFSYFFFLFFIICLFPERALAIGIRQINCHCEDSQTASGTTKQSLNPPLAPFSKGGVWRQCHTSCPHNTNRKAFNVLATRVIISVTFTFFNLSHYNPAIELMKQPPPPPPPAPTADVVLTVLAPDSTTSSMLGALSSPSESTDFTT
jgi:hypothetical protein